MKAKRIVSLALCAALAGSLLSGCGAAKKKDITLVLKAPTLSFAENARNEDIQNAGEFLQAAGDAFAAQYTDANVTVKVIEYENTEETAYVDDCFDTEDAVDVLYNDFFTMEAHVHTGKVVPLDDIISEDLKADIADTFWNQGQINGKTYMMPYLYRQNVLVYSNEWFRKAGLDQYVTDGSTVETWTMDEWEEILAALREAMPDTSYPMMMYALNNQGDTHITCFLRSQGSDFFDENMRFDLETEEGIAGLQWIRDCIDKGYMPENAADMEALTCYDMFLSGQMAIFFCNAASEPNFTDYGLVNFPTVNGGCNTNFLTGFEVYDNGDADKLAAAKAFVKYIYESEYIDYETTSMPCNTSVAEKYADFLAPYQKYIDNADKGVNFTGGNPNWLGVRSVFYLHMQDLVRGDKTPEEVAKELDADANAAIEEGYTNSSLHE